VDCQFVQPPALAICTIFTAKAGLDGIAPEYLPDSIFAVVRKRPVNPSSASGVLLRYFS
jgi:hypothetical protein